MWKTDYCGNTIKSKNMVQFQSGKQTDCKNAIKTVNAVKFQMRGNRQIFNSVEYSESNVNSYFGTRKCYSVTSLFNNMTCTRLRNSVTSSLANMTCTKIMKPCTQRSRETSGTNSESEFGSHQRPHGGFCRLALPIVSLLLRIIM